MLRISTKTHGLLDYTVGAALAALPKLLDCTPATQRILSANGLGAAVYSLMTNYERGVVKVLPMKGHLALDALSGATLIGAAVVLDDERPEVRALLAGLGAFELAVTSMTSTEPYSDGEQPSVAEHARDLVSAHT